LETNNNLKQDAGTSAWPLWRVGLRIQDMERSLDYYTRLGFSIVRDERAQESGSVGLGVEGKEILQLRPLPGGQRRPARTAGLYHFALLLPSAGELGSFLQNSLDRNIPVAGASDHLVSQALYLSDPEGNGIEVYADRPREQWQFREGTVVMDTLPLDAPGLLKQARTFPGFSSQLRLGHLHLNVGDLERSLSFYQKLGMGLMADWAGQADFLSWEKYHHHLGINVWAGRNAHPVTPDMYGLDFFEIQRPGLAPAILQDPDGITVVIR
jgi:catechol 2,3-dioxygenase